MTATRIIPVFRMFFRDRFNWFYLPWIILLSSFVVNLLISKFIPTVLYSGGVSSIVVYFLVLAIVILPHTFPFALGMGTTRTDFFFGAMLAFLSFAVIVSALLVLIGQIEQWTGYWGGDLHFFHLPFVNDGHLFEQFVSYTLLCLFMNIWGFSISSYYRRFGINVLLLSFVAGTLVLTVVAYMIHYNNGWATIYTWMLNQTMLSVCLWLLPFIVLGGGFSYLMLRRSTV